MPLPRLTRLSLLCLIAVVAVFAAGCGSGGTPVVWQPAFSPAPGNYAAPQSVTLTEPLSDATIYYTTDGSLPTAASTRYTGPILVASTTTLEVTAVISGYRNSPAIAATYVIAAPQPFATPTFTPPAGTYAVAQSVSIGDSTSNAQIFYTTDGTTPTPQSTLFTSPIQVAATETLQAIATAPNFAPSPVATATYTIAALAQAATPTFNTPAGTYTSRQTIQIADATPAATMFFTTDGTTPTASSSRYTAPIAIASTTTLQAIATAPNFAPSQVATALYTIGTQPSGKGMWTWMGGTDVAEPPPVYGTLGIAAPANSPGNTRPTPFPDAGGTVYLYGGELYGTTAKAGGFLDTLWQFDPATALFTWSGGSQSLNPPASFGSLGVSSASNQPPARVGGSTWTDGTGKLWLFGGGTEGPSFVLLGDLWEYDPATSLWTWVGGSQDLAPATVYGTLGVPADSNYPGQRYVPACKDDKDNVYLFGGFQQQAGFGTDGYLNDLWRFDIAKNQWTWLSGSTQFNQPGWYGTLGVAAPGNTPGARINYNCWSDKSGNIWIFGGLGYDSSTNPFGSMELNDLWEFNTSTGLWTWVSGSSTRNSLGDFGTQGLPSPTNQPPSRDVAASWTDANGDLWLFGGAVMNAQYGSPIVANDLWRFNIATSEWTWMNGANTVAQYATYGTLGVPAASNVPGARDGDITWVDAQGNLWLYGGFGNSDNNNSGDLGDLWRYQP